MVSKSIAEKFDKLDPAAQRVCIAKDALSQLLAKRFISTNTYLRVSLNNKHTPSSKLATVLKNKRCQVCALGALFRSAILIKNGIQIKDVSDCATEIALSRYRIADRLRPYFSSRQLTQIEAAFEGTIIDEGGLTTEDIKYTNTHVNRWNSFYDNMDLEQRMRVILKNIIRNKGTFNLEDISLK